MNRYDISTSISFPDRVDIMLSAFPNPMTASATLDFAKPLTAGSVLEVSDITGKLVQRRSVSGNRILIERNEWDCGLYLVSVSTPDGDRYLAKLIVQ